MDDVLYPTRDGNFNVTALFADDGTLVRRYTYNPYGRRTWTDYEEGEYEWTLGHQGMMHDTETNLVYNRARMLHPTSWRFLQRDPLGYVDGMGLYVSRRSNTIITVDATAQYGGAGGNMRYCTGCGYWQPRDHKCDTPARGTNVPFPPNLLHPADAGKPCCCWPPTKLPYARRTDVASRYGLNLGVIV